MKYRRVVWSESRPKNGGVCGRRVYDHYFRVRLECGHWQNAKPVKGGECPATVNCDRCGRSGPGDWEM